MAFHAQAVHSEGMPPARRRYTASVASPATDLRCSAITGDRATHNRSGRRVKSTAIRCFCVCTLVAALSLLTLSWKMTVEGGAWTPCRKPPDQQPRIKRIAYTPVATNHSSATAAAGGMGERASPLVEDKYTIIINSFRRHTLLKAALAHYSVCPQAEAIHVVWSEDLIGPPPASKDASFYGTGDAEVVYDLQPTSSLNNRFAPLPGLRTLAILSMDDDIRVPCSEVARTFAVWQHHKDQMVGWFPRGVRVRWNRRKAAASSTAAGNGSGMGQQKTERQPGSDVIPSWHSGEDSSGKAGCSFQYLSRDASVLMQGKYNMMLTKGAFLHRDWLTTYSAAVPPAVTAYIDANRNCEDIAMAFVVADATGLPPIYNRAPSLQDLGQGLLKIKGISSLAGHAGGRSACVEAFATEFGGLPLVDRLLSLHDRPLQLRLSTLLDRAI